MNDLIFAAILASISRFVRLRRKEKYPENERIEVHLPEWIKFLMYWLFMILWIKSVNALMESVKHL